MVCQVMNTADAASRRHPLADDRIAIAVGNENLGCKMVSDFTAELRGHDRPCRLTHYFLGRLERKALSRSAVIELDFELRLQLVPEGRHKKLGRLVPISNAIGNVI